MIPASGRGVFNLAGQPGRVAGVQMRAAGIENSAVGLIEQLAAQIHARYSRYPDARGEAGLSF